MNLEKGEIFMRLGNMGSAMMVLKKIEEESLMGDNDSLAYKFHFLKAEMLFELA